MLQIMYSAIQNVIFVSSAHLGQRVSPLSGTNPVEHGDFDTLPIVASSYSRLVFLIQGLCMWVVFRHHIGGRIEALCRQVGAILEVQKGTFGGPCTQKSIDNAPEPPNVMVMPAASFRELLRPTHFLQLRFLSEMSSNLLGLR
jgi:hypothetical protein